MVAVAEPSRELCRFVDQKRRELDDTLGGQTCGGS
jgi:hypothetical protein